LYIKIEINSAQSSLILSLPELHVAQTAFPPQLVHRCSSKSDLNSTLPETPCQHPCTSAAGLKPSASSDDRRINCSHCRLASRGNTSGQGADNKVTVKLGHQTDCSLRKKFCKHSYSLLSFLVSITFSPSAYSTHSPPPFSRQQVFSRISSPLQPWLALTVGVSVLACPQTLVGQTRLKGEPSEEPGFPAKHPNYGSQHQTNLC